MIGIVELLEATENSTTEERKNIFRIYEILKAREAEASNLYKVFTEIKDGLNDYPRIFSTEPKEIRRVIKREELDALLLFYNDKDLSGCKFIGIARGRNGEELEGLEDLEAYKIMSAYILDIVLSYEEDYKKILEDLGV